MNAKPTINMLEATRLTREGRLAEAMAVLRGECPGINPSSALSDDRGDASQRTSGHFSQIIDMVPPSSGGGAWTPPKFNASHFTPSAFDNLAGGLGQAQVPEALRGFLDRMGQPGSAVSLDGLVGPTPARAPAPLPEGAWFEEKTLPTRPGAAPISCTSQAATRVNLCYSW